VECHHFHRGNVGVAVGRHPLALPLAYAPAQKFAGHDNRFGQTGKVKTVEFTA
jgi:hypothetical protein